MLTVAPVRKQIVVDAAVDRAFDVFTAGIATWWPMATHRIGAAEPETVVLEPHVGGRWYERGTDGSECNWGKVLAWDPPARVVLTWEISADWAADPTIASEIEVRFVAESPTRTRVELEHRGLEHFGARGEEMRGVFDSDGGWNLLLGRYQAALD